MDFFVYLIVSCLFVLYCTTQVVADDEFEGFSVLTLEHSFDQGLNPVFTKRGAITIRSLKAGMADYEDEGGLDEEDISLLKAAIKQDGIYRIRVRGKQAVENEHMVSTFIKACALYESKLSDILTLNVDHMGIVLAISHNAAKPYCEGISVSNRNLANFNTTVEIVQTAIGPIPETQSYIQKMEQEQAEKTKGAQGDNRSFFGKYWMYLVPVIFIMMMVNSNEPQK